jgi:hypothetical protein
MASLLLMLYSLLLVVRLSLLSFSARLNHHASSRATMNETEGDDSRGRKQYNRGTAKVDN